MKKNQNGITLIALVITIIVLLILAGVSIAMLTGDNGILNQGTRARKENNEAEIADKINMALNGEYGNLMADGKFTTPNDDDKKKAGYTSETDDSDGAKMAEARANAVIRANGLDDTYEVTVASDLTPTPSDPAKEDEMVVLTISKDGLTGTITYDPDGSYNDYTIQKVEYPKR